MEWIPVSEKMPDNGQDCIVTIRMSWFGGEPVYFVNMAKYSENRFNDGDRWIHGVTAWMPMPKPYKEAI